MEDKDIREICMTHQMQCNKITKAIGSFDKELFIIDDQYLIRTSKQSMREELNKINRVKELNHVPKIVHTSDQIITGCNTNYLILEYIQGHELYANYEGLQEQNLHDIGIEIADFLLELHKLTGENYDIGHYVPIISEYDKSWRSGHEIYWKDIYKGLKQIQLSDEMSKLLELSHEYINTNLSCLDFEHGPSLLHNDFHYKNIIIYNNAFSGVIDWECSQYGEADFDLQHILHWSLFPPSKDYDMTQLFTTIFLEFMGKCSIPMIEKRLCIYLLEHDFIQILWSQGKRAEEMKSRIKWWLNHLESYILNL